MKTELIVIVFAAAVLGAVVWQLQRAPEGPESVAWDQATCVHCQMHVGEPRFAAQLQTEEGRVHNFDDPGCLFEYVDTENPNVAAMYFRHHRRDEWVAGSEVRFVESDEPTPMGYGLAAVTAEEVPEGRPLEEWIESITSSHHRHEEPIDE